jgi:hypothetical protein
LGRTPGVGLSKIVGPVGQDLQVGDGAVLILDSLSMLVISDLVGEIDASLAEIVHSAARGPGRGRRQAAEALAAWIDFRLDERLTLRVGEGRPRRD